MRELIDVAYGHTGRVHALDNDNVFIGYRMGNTLVMVHHTDKCKPKDLIGVMVTDFRKDFGETEFHYIDHGHIHTHYVSKEYPSVVIESWNHLAPNDKWAHDSGYRSRKAISVVLRSRTYGEIGRRLLPLEEVRARLAKANNSEPTPKRETYTV
jgi:DNA repair exonuclease SbcCD nuclease subunit